MSIKDFQERLTSNRCGTHKLQIIEKLADNRVRGGTMENSKINLRI